VSRELAVLLAVVAGGLIALQAPFNSTLGRTVGTFTGVALSFAIGTAALVGVMALAREDPGRVTQAASLPWYTLTGGVLGAIYVVVALLTVRSLGAGGVTAATICGQLATSLAIDRLGAFGLQERATSPSRVVGVALLVAGTYLVIRE
jgi:bacterial/archaeal transporter family-2 protein